MPKLVCCKCAVELRCDKNGVPAIEMADWGQYKIYGTDRWKCPICEYTVLAGFSDGVEHWEEHFAHLVEQSKGDADTIIFGIAYTKEEIALIEKKLLDLE